MTITFALLISIVSLIVTVAITALKGVHAYGRMVEALTILGNEVKEMRSTLANTLHRIGRLETRDEVEREFSGRVRGRDGQ